MATWNFNTAGIAGVVHGRKVQRDLDAREAVGLAAAKAVCPEKSGHLKTTIRGEPLGAGRRLSYGNDGDAWYAPLIEWGTRPHEIRPVRAKALRWEDETGVHFATRVWHPGTRAYRVMSGAALEAARRPPNP